MTMDLEIIQRLQILLHLLRNRRVSQIAVRYDVSLACWEDGLYTGDDGCVMNRSHLTSNRLFTYAWNNVWQYGKGRRAYELANSGFKVGRVLL